MFFSRLYLTMCVWKVFLTIIEEYQCYCKFVCLKYNLRLISIIFLETHKYPDCTTATLYRTLTSDVRIRIVNLTCAFDIRPKLFECRYGSDRAVSSARHCQREAELWAAFSSFQWRILYEARAESFGLIDSFKAPIFDT